MFMKARVLPWAKSTYAGQTGRVTALANGKQQWTTGSAGRAKYFRLEFTGGHCAYRNMWYSSKEIEIITQGVCNG